MLTRMRLHATALTVVALLATACGGDADDGASEPTAGTETEDGGEAASEEIEATLSFGHVLAEAQPWHQCGALEFKSDVEAADVGLTVEVFPAAQTQSNTLEQLDALGSGDLDLTFAGPAQMATRYGRVAVFDAAYIFNDVDHMQSVTRGELGQSVFEEFREESGMRVLSTGYYGARHVTANRPVRTPDDLEGVKMRVPDAPLYLDNGRALGADPTPVAFGELYLALQQGVVDAQENPLPVIDSQGFTEVQDFVSLTGHNIAILGLLISDSTWNELSSAQQEAVQEAAVALGDNVTQCTVAGEEDLLEAWTSGDETPIEVVQDVDLDAFRTAAAEYLIPKYEDEWGDLYREVRDAG